MTFIKNVLLSCLLSHFYVSIFRFFSRFRFIFRLRGYLRYRFNMHAFLFLDLAHSLVRLSRTYFLKRWVRKYSTPFCSHTFCPSSLLMENFMKQEKFQSLIFSLSLCELSQDETRLCCQYCSLSLTLSIPMSAQHYRAYKISKVSLLILKNVCHHRK